MRNYLPGRRLWFWVLTATVVAGCASTPTKPAYRKALKTEYGKIAGYSPTQQQWIKDNCPLEMPKRQAGIDFGYTQVIVRRGYVLEHSVTDKIPMWVCERVTRAQVSGPLGRPKSEPFAPDPELQGERRAELSDYKRSGYDRGHQAPSADQTVDPVLQAETYYLSNMAPQFAALNQRIWKELETSVRKQAKAMDPVYVITGPMFYDEAEDDPATADGYVEYTVIGNDVAVPTHFYKIVYWMDAQQKWQAIAFLMKNQKEPFPEPHDFKQYIRPVKWIEDRTGLDFNPALPTPDHRRVEVDAGHLWN